MGGACSRGRAVTAIAFGTGGTCAAVPIALAIHRIASTDCGPIAIAAIISTSTKRARDRSRSRDASRDRSSDRSSARCASSVSSASSASSCSSASSARSSRDDDKGARGASSGGGGGDKGASGGKGQASTAPGANTISLQVMFKTTMVIFLLTTTNYVHFLGGGGRWVVGCTKVGCYSVTGNLNYQAMLFMSKYHGTYGNYFRPRA